MQLEQPTIELMNQLLTGSASRIRYERPDPEVDALRNSINSLSHYYINLRYGDSGLSNKKYLGMENRLYTDIVDLYKRVDELVSQREEQRRAQGEPIRPNYDHFNLGFLEDEGIVDEAYSRASWKDTELPEQWDMENKRQVLGHNEDVWEFAYMSDDAEHSSKESPLDGGTVKLVSEAIASGRCTIRDCVDKQAVSEATLAVETYLHQLGTTERNNNIAIPRSIEVFDMAYGLAWMRNQGVDIDRHPELRSYQTYYEAGMPPPTHEEMARFAIQKFGRHGANPDALQRIVGDAPNVVSGALERQLHRSLRPQSHIEPGKSSVAPTGGTPKRGRGLRERLGIQRRRTRR